MINKMISRRGFVKSGASLATGAGLLLSGIAPSFALPKIPIKVTPSPKALVFIMLDGGNDSFNMLVPKTEPHYSDYRVSRSNLALAKDQLLPLSGFIDKNMQSFGVHHSMPEVQQLFNDEKLAFIANIAPMIEPVNKLAMAEGSANLPLGLLSHADQYNHWQTARADQRVSNGWFGAIADSLRADRLPHQIPMNISLAGSNIMQNGQVSAHYSITQRGSVGLVVNKEKTPLNNELLNSFEQLLNENFEGDPFKQSYLALTREAQSQHQIFFDATDKVSLPTSFSDTDLSQQLQKVAQTIKAADDLNLEQQTYFLRYIGWDHHDELLNNHATMLRVLSKGLGEFQNALSEMRLADQVVTFTGSDFGRTLTSNGNGTDHGWGGNTLVMGNAVDGGKIFGQYPELSLGDANSLDAGDGVIIPTTATEQLYADLAIWFGVDRSSLNDLFPNLKNFSPKHADGTHLGIIKG